MKSIVWLVIVLGSFSHTNAATATFKKEQTNATDYDYDKTLEGDDDDLIMEEGITDVAQDGDDDELIMEEDVCGSCACTNLTEPYIVVDCSDASLSSLPDWILILSNATESSVPDWLLGFSNATHVDLDLSTNTLVHVQALPPLPLWSMDLSRNNIGTLDAAAFSNVGFTLLYLDLSHNQLDGDSFNSTTFLVKHNDSDRTASPAALLELNLSDNRLNWLDPTTFSHLVNLQNLDLSDNPLGDLTNDTAEAIRSIVTLQTLNLRQVGLKHLPENFFTGLNQLANLDLSGNGLHVVPPQLGKAASLSSLQLNNNNLHSLEADSFLGLKNLQTLSVSNNFALRKINTGAFTPLVSLEKLLIEDNPALSWISPGAWDMYSAHFKLKELFLANNKLKYLPTQLLPDFSNWRDLDVTDLQGNPWWCDCHNDWVINTLVPMIHDKTPELTSSITCAGPPNFSLVKEELIVVHAMTPAAELPCNQDNFDPWESNFGLHPMHQEWLEASEARLNSELPTALVVLCVLSVAATAVLVGVLYARQKKIQPAGAVRFSRGGPKTTGARVTRYSRPGAMGVENTEYMGATGVENTQYMGATGVENTKYMGATGVENTEYRDDESTHVNTQQVRTVRQWPPEEDKVPDLQL